MPLAGGKAGLPQTLSGTIFGSLAKAFSVQCCAETETLEHHFEVDFLSPRRILKVREEPMSPSAASSASAASDEDLEEGCPDVMPEGCTAEDLAPWLEAAASFHMNTDFDVADSLPDLEGEEHLSLDDLMGVMKAESGGKQTIQALGDKILLGKLLSNIGIPQMPMMFEAYSEVQADKVKELVDRLAESKRKDAFDIVVKPTHLSNGTGALILSTEAWKAQGYGVEKLVTHMETYLKECAADSESEALRSLVPGFMVQPRYRSCVDFGHPLEMRIVTLWGRARLGVWWWGRPGSPGKPQRTTWFVRSLAHPDKLSRKDTWEAIHNHTGHNRGFDVALEIFRRAMPAMALAAEAIATAVGAPFLRSDFFVGSNDWGVRLNEVAYGSGVDYKRRPTVGAELADDGPAIARILQDGNALCKKHPPEQFLSRLGAVGSSYTLNPPEWWEWWRSPEDEAAGSPTMAVEDMPESKRPGLSRWVLRDFAPDSLVGVQPVASSGCQTPRSQGCPTPRGHSVVSAAPRSAVALVASGSPVAAVKLGTPQSWALATTIQVSSRPSRSG